MLLLSDGTVMASKNDGMSIGNGWYRLTPDIHGSYVQGTWTTLAAAHDTRLYYPTQVLRDGRVFVAGGEYGSGGPKAEVYDPLTNAWTQTNPPAGLWNQSNDNFYDCNSEILPDGRVLLMPVFPEAPGVGLIYDPTANTWTNAAPLFRGHDQDEATWVKLADNSVLTIDPFGTFSERYIPATHLWIDDGIVPLPLYDPIGFELGASLLLPNGKAFFLGSTGHTALYTPTGTTAPGTWSAGPDIPGAHGTPDAPAAMMVNGKILCAVSPIPFSGNAFPSPTSFYEYDWVSNTFASVGGPTGPTENGPTYGEVMLDLPDGSVLFSHFSSQLYVYRPTGAALAAGKPTIANISMTGLGTYHLEGTGLNGISEGASYGDDNQMNSNYPLVRLTNGAGNVYYARTYNWSSTGVQTGAALIATEFSIAASVPAGPYSLEVVANGIASDATPFVIPGCVAPATYCTAKITSAFTVPVIGYTGLPSLSGSGFTVTLSQALPNKNGILFYGMAQTAVPFQGGTMCTQTPVVRSPVLTTSAVGFASLAITIDPSMTTTTRYYQWWFRDPQDQQTTGLSDALAVSFCD
jgi:hypothetical protein